MSGLLRGDRPVTGEEGLHMHKVRWVYTYRTLQAFVLWAFLTSQIDISHSQFSVCF